MCVCVCVCVRESVHGAVEAVQERTKGRMLDGMGSSGHVVGRLPVRI